MPLQKSTLRDWSGGLNVADNEKSLDSRFLVDSDNIDVGIDAALRVRYGYELYKDLEDGAETTYTGQSVDVKTTAVVGQESIVTIGHTSHGFSSGDHVHFSNLTTVASIPASELNALHGIVVVDADNYKFAVRTAASGAVTSTQSADFVHDTHTISGRTLNAHYFKGSIYVFSANGEAAKIASDLTVTKLWDYNIVAGIHPATVMPWRECSLCNADVFKQRLIVCNGKNKDKPLEINTNAANEIDFFVDPATSTNAPIPTADYVLAINKYLIFASTDEVDGSSNLIGETYLEISDTNGLGVYTGSASPGVAVDLDLSTQTSAGDPEITGVNVLRNQMFVSLKTQSMLGTIGTIVSSAHEPDFGDTISEHGALSHRGIINLGNDLLMMDYAGVPSLTLSQVTASIVPERVSQLIDPLLQKNLDRLSEATKRDKIFGVFAIHGRKAMFFVPKYDTDVLSTDTDPICITNSLGQVGRFILSKVEHKLDEGDTVTIAGSSTVGNLAAGDINGDRVIVHVVDRDTLIVQSGASSYVEVSKDDGGGGSVTITPVNDETLVYVYSLSSRKKSRRRWSRYRGMNFDWATRTATGLVLVGKNEKVYALGDDANPLYADQVGDYDTKSWATSTAYTVGYRILDSSVVYVCAVAHTSASSGTFADDRTANPTYWDVDEGVAITWSAESPWSDFGQRKHLKLNRYLQMDAEGAGGFTVEAYVDNLYKDRSTYERSPACSLDFVGEDAPGYGAGDQGYSGGRRTREEFLHAFAFRAMLAKLRFSGSTKNRTKLLGATLMYNVGNIAR